MFEVIYQQKDGPRQRFNCSDGACTIGCGSGNQIILDGKAVSKKHARLLIVKDGVTVEDMGSMTGTWVNQERIVNYGPISDIDEIVIGTWRIRVQGKAKQTSPPTAQAHQTLGAEPPATTTAATASTTPSVAAEKKPASTPTPPRISPEVYEWRNFVHSKLLDMMDLRRKDVHSMSDQELRNETEALIREILKTHNKDIPKNINRDGLLTDVLNEAVGLGPLENLLADDSVTEIMVNKSDEIFVERDGKLELSELTFSNARSVLGVIERIVSPLGRRIDESSPLVDARLKDGSRVNAIIPPLAIKGPSITIRKFAKRKLSVDDLIAFNSVSPEMVKFLQICVLYRRNIIISGGTGSGKTTLLNILSNIIPDDERIVSIEDAAELQLNQPNLVSLEARPPNLEGKGAIHIRDLVKNSLRMRPDRIVVGECRGGEALDMLQAMNTGHDGSLTTAHANNPRDMLSRLEVMVLMAGMDLPVTAIREQTASAVDIIVQQTRFTCGTRKVTYITEVSGIESGKIQLQNIFTYNQQGFGPDGKVVGEFKGCGFVPTFYEQLSKIGIDVDLSIFGEAEGSL